MKTHTHSGQGVIEYIILVAIIAVASLGIVRILGGTVSSKLAQIPYSLQGQSRRADRVTIPEVEEKHWRTRGMEDFYEASD